MRSGNAISLLWQQNQFGRPTSKINLERKEQNNTKRAKSILNEGQQNQFETKNYTEHGHHFNLYEAIILTRHRIVYAVLLVIVIAFGLASRHYSDILPYFIATYAGDTLWALMVFLLIGFVFPAFSTLKVATIALLFSFSIELSQLYHAPWIDQLRQYRLVALVIGHGFLWTDWLCYSVGVMIGVVGEMVLGIANN